MSASQTTGIFTASAMYLALATISVMVNSPTSGKPLSAAVPEPVMYTASNPTDSAILACIALRMNGAVIICPEASICRSLVVDFISNPPLYQPSDFGNQVTRCAIYCLHRRIKRIAPPPKEGA